MFDCEFTQPHYTAEKIYQTLCSLTGRSCFIEASQDRIGCVRRKFALEYQANHPLVPRKRIKKAVCQREMILKAMPVHQPLKYRILRRVEGLLPLSAFAFKGDVEREGFGVSEAMGRSPLE